MQYPKRNLRDNRFVIDEETSPVVKLIFSIAEEGVDCPRMIFQKIIS